MNIDSYHTNDAESESPLEDISKDISKDILSFGNELNPEISNKL